MWPDWVSNPGPPTYESGALPIALRGPANHLGGLSQSRISMVRLIDGPDMTIAFYCEATKQQSMEARTSRVIIVNICIIYTNTNEP